MNIVSSFTKFLAENWKRTRMCVKILFAGIFVLALLVPLNYLNLYFHINSGGLKPSGEICFWTFAVFGGILSCLYLFAGICLILSFFRAPKITNFIVSLVGVFLVYSINYMCYGDKISHFFGQTKEDLLRYYGYNAEAIENLKKFSKEITKDDFAFTEQSLKNIATPDSFDEEWQRYIFNPDFDFNKNLLGLKANQINKDTVVLFQSKNEISPLAEANDISAEWHYGKGSLIVFGDGRIEFVKKENFKNLRWQP